MAQPAQAISPDPESAVDDVEALRADTYGLLAALLGREPEATLLEALRDMAVEDNSDTEGIRRAWNTLRLAALRAEPTPLRREYFTLFIGIGRGELVPYASWYQTGFLMEKPLARLRSDLASLGFERQADVSEPEDHIAALLEVMAMLIRDPAVDFFRARKFFDDHLAPWAEAFFADLQQAESAGFYRAVGELGMEFMALEKRYLEMLV